MALFAIVVLYVARLLRLTASTLLEWFFALIGRLHSWNNGMILPEPLLHPTPHEDGPTSGSSRIRALHPEYRDQCLKDEEQLIPSELHHDYGVAQRHDCRVAQSYNYKVVQTEVECISLGVPKKNLKTQSPSSVVLPELRTTNGHTVLSEASYDTVSELADRKEDPRLSHPDYVKMPFSQSAECTVPGKSLPCQRKTVLKWPVICKALTKSIPEFNDLKNAIWSYNESYTNVWDFNGLQVFLDNHLDEGERKEFFHHVLPEMAKLVLRLPQLCSEPIPLLRTGTAHSITMSQEQAACLLANAFFCTFPGCNTHNRSNFPGINFNRLYRGPISPKRAGKLRCLLHYFKTVTENMPQGNLTYSRQVLKHHEFPKWARCDKHFPQLHVSSGGTIEDDGYGMLQMDFANKYIGGGVLGEGSVQEEIRFVICPELIVSLLLTEVLDPNEAVVITGPQRFSNYKGYAKSFQWDGDYEDPTPPDNWGRRCTQVVAIDAINVRYDLNQFDAKQVCRELNKAYVGFYDPYAQPTRTAVATGNWGCGAFGGDLRLKALIQLMAAAAAGRDVCYFTYKDNTLTQDIYDIHKLITDRGLTVGDVWGLICDYNTTTHARKNVFEFIQERLMPSYPPSTSQDIPSYAGDPHMGNTSGISNPEDPHMGNTSGISNPEDPHMDNTSGISNPENRDKVSTSMTLGSSYGDGKEGDNPTIHSDYGHAVDENENNDDEDIWNQSNSSVIKKGNSDDKVTGNSDDKVTGNSDDKVTGNSDDKVTGNSDDKVTGNSDDKVTGNSDDKVTGNSDDKVTGNSDNNVTETVGLNQINLDVY